MLVKKINKNHKIIIDAGVEISIKNGLEKTYISMISDKIGKFHSFIYNYFPSMDDLRNKILERAIDEEILEIVADGLVSKRIFKSDISDDLFKKVLSIFQERVIG